MQLEKQATGVAEDRAGFVPAPQGGSGSAAILTDGLQLGSIVISQGGRHYEGASKVKKNRDGRSDKIVRDLSR